MNVNRNACDGLNKIEWFSSLGEQYALPNVKLAVSLNDAHEYLSSPEWENVTLEESNNISEYLSVKHSMISQEWNKLAKEAKVFLKNELINKIPQLDCFDNKLLLQCVEWDVVHYLIEDAYKDKLKKPLFFNSLMSVYESGHIPCGWDGEWPEGTLVIY